MDLEMDSLLESNRQQLLEEEMAENILEGLDPDEQMLEDNLNGVEAGEAFAHRHIIEKMNLFIDEYRKNGYTEDFISGFLDGVNNITGGAIHLEGGDEQAAAS